MVAFIKGWRLALVMLACLPFLVVAGGFMALLIGKLASRGQMAYAKAANIVEQTLGSIRTVSCCCQSCIGIILLGNSYRIRTYLMLYFHF